MIVTQLILSSIVICFWGCQQSAELNSTNSKISVVNVQQSIIKHIDATECKRLIENNVEVQLVDVRTSGECATGILANAQTIDIYSPNFKNTVSKLDKNKPIVLYCAVGGRSRQAAQVLKSLGFKDIYNLKGGIQSWKAKGLPIEKK